MMLFVWRLRRAKTGELRASPLGSLWLRICIALLAGTAAFATFVIWYSVRTLSVTYAEAGKSDALAIARTFSDDVTSRDLLDRRMHERLRRLQQLHPQIEELSLYAYRNGRYVRLVSTDPGELSEPVKPHDVEPLRTGMFEYEEEREPGQHFGELNFPMRDGGRPFAVLGLYFDLGPLDASLARRKTELTVAASITALLLTLLLTLILGRSVFAPLQKLRVATHRIAEGELATRLHWSRRDELGTLAREFDRMAAELEVKHTRLEDLALTDPLTGIANHRAFHERLTAELERARRHGYPVSLVSLDVDHFKSVNDRLGHAAGDEALRLASRVIAAETRASDVCARLGGDEFALVLPETSAAEAAEVVARVRRSVARTPIGGTAEHLTVSAGIAEFPSDTSEQGELIRLADGALYQAKRNGRDQCCIYSSGRDEPLSPEEHAEHVRLAGLRNTIHALARAVDAKDGYTHQHSARVASYAACLAVRLGMAADRVQLVRTAGVLHDIGKIGISDAILLKPGKLTESEYEEMKHHSELGRDIIAGAGMPESAKWVAHLHERFDGRGYPDGLAGEHIPLESRILAVADALEAMTSSRLYHAALSVEEAIAELELNAGTQFDPRVVRHAVEALGSGELVVPEGEPADEPISAPVAVA